MLNTVIFAALFAFTISYIATPLVRKLAFAIGAVDIPDARKVHARTMPRLGGLAIYLAFTITLMMFYDLNKEIIGLVLGGSIITLIGICDDKWGVSPLAKLAGQIFAATVLIGFGIKVGFITNPMGQTMELGLLSVPVTILWVVGVTNAVNLIDGLDGLAAGISAISAATLGIVALLGGNSAFALAAFILTASSVGFLKHNFYPAKIFMGDSGSMFLGFNLAAIAVLGLAKSVTIVSLFIPILIIGIPIFDTFFAIIRRLTNKKRIFDADKDHLHHRLLAMGLSHKHSVLVIYAVGVFLGFSAVILEVVTNAQAMIITVSLSLLIFIAAERIGILSVKPKTQQKTATKTIVPRKEELE